MQDAPHFKWWPKHHPKELTYPSVPVHANLDAAAARFGDRAFIHFYGRAISWAEAKDAVDRLAGYLQKDAGVQKGDRVLLYAQNSPHYIFAFTAILKCGAVVVPVSPMNRAHELEHFVTDSGATAAFVGQELMDNTAELAGSFTKRIAIAYNDYASPPMDMDTPDDVRAPAQTFNDPTIVTWAKALAANLTADAVEIAQDALAALPYTSGSTGLPKGCMLTHAAIQASSLNSALWEDLDEHSVALVVAPMTHISGQQMGMNRSILVGATIVLMQRWNPALAARLVEEFHCTHLNMVPVMAGDLLSDPEAARYSLKSVKVISGGGAAMPAAQSQKLLDTYGLKFLEGYGLTEICCQSHVNPPDRIKLQCMGIPIFGMESRVIDIDTHDPLPPGESGEIVLRGASLFSGYWNNDAANREAFVEIGGKTWYRTGDIGWMDEDGYFFFAERLKRMINAAGLKVWPVEVESMMYRHPAVRDCCIIAAPDARRGETVKAVIVLKDGAGDTSAKEIIDWAHEQMAPYKAPRIIEFVDALPRGTTGKVNWRELQEREFGGAATSTN